MTLTTTPLKMGLSNKTFIQMTKHKFISEQQDVSAILSLRSKYIFFFSFTLKLTSYWSGV